MDPVSLAELNEPNELTELNEQRFDHFVERFDRPW